MRLVIIRENTPQRRRRNQKKQAGPALRVHDTKRAYSVSPTRRSTAQGSDNKVTRGAGNKTTPNQTQAHKTRTTRPEDSRAHHLIWGLVPFTTSPKWNQRMIHFRNKGEHEDTEAIDCYNCGALEDKYQETALSRATKVDRNVDDIICDKMARPGKTGNVFPTSREA